MAKVIDENGRVVKAGGIVTSEQNGKKVYLIIFRGNHQDYSFPKGHAEEGERPEECAVREVLEETGLLTNIVKELEPELYFNTKSDEETILHMYLMDVVSGELKTENSGDKLIWSDQDEIKKLVHPNIYKYFQSISSEL